MKAKDQGRSRVITSITLGMPKEDRATGLLTSTRTGGAVSKDVAYGCLKMAETNQQITESNGGGGSQLQFFTVFSNGEMSSAGAVECV